MLQDYDDPNATSAAISKGESGLAVLWLDTPAEQGGLPTARTPGGADHVVSTVGEDWHVHMGGWSPDSRRLAYTRVLDHGDIFELLPAVE